MSEAADASRAIESALRDFPLAGVGWAIVIDAEIRAIEHRGVAGPEEIFRIASITKTMTARLVMQLVAQGTLSLDDALADHLISVEVPSYPGARPPSILDALTHTGGYGAFRALSELSLGGLKGLVRGRAGQTTDLSTFYSRGLRPHAAPGERWEYSNNAYGLLGQLVADVCHEPLGEIFTRELFEPASMTSSSIGLASQRGARLQGHARYLGRIHKTRAWELTPTGAGAVCASLQDMARYLALLCRCDPMTASMAQQAWSYAPQLPGMGFGFMRDTIGDVGVIGHDGNLSGFTSSMWLAPQLGCGVIVLANTAQRGVRALVDAGLRALLGASSLESELAALEPATDEDAVGAYALTPGWLSNLSGLANTGRSLQIESKHGSLVVGRAGDSLPAPLKQGGDMMHAGVRRKGQLRHLRIALERDGSHQVFGIAGHLQFPYRMIRRPAAPHR